MDKYARKYLLIDIATFVVATVVIYLLIGFIFAPVGINPDGEVMRRFGSLLLGGFALSFSTILR